MNPSCHLKGLKFHPSYSLLSALLLLGSASFAHAQTTKAADSMTNTVAVTVSAERTERTADEKAGSVTVITADTLEQRGVSDLGGIVRYEPLVSAPFMASGGGSVWDGSGYSGYNVRGLEGNRVALTIDGISLPDAAPRPDSAQINGFGIGRDYIDPEMFRSAEIFSGTTGTQQNNSGLGGGVAFVTKSPEDYLIAGGRPFYLGYKVGYFSANESLAHTATAAARAGEHAQALIVYTHRDGQETESAGTTAPNPTDWQSDALLAKVIWTPSVAQRVEFAADYFNKDTDVTVGSKTSASYPDGVSQNSTTERWTLSATHRFTPVAPLPLFDSLKTKIYYQDASSQDLTFVPRYLLSGVYRKRTIDTGLYDKSFGLTSEAVKRIGESQRLAYGVSGSQQETKRPWTEIQTNLTTGVVTPYYKDRMADTKTTRLSAYLEDEFSFKFLGRPARLTPGTRLEYRNTKPGDLSGYISQVPSAKSEIVEETETYATPSLSFLVEMTDTLNAYVQYNRGVRVPTPGEKTGTYNSFSYTGGTGYAVFGNADLKKETSDAFEAGLKGQFAKGLTFHAAAFYTSYANYIDYVVQPLDPVNYPTVFLLYRPENIGDVAIYGGEFSTVADLGTWSDSLRGFRVNAAAGYSRGTAENTTTGARGWLPSVTPFKGNIALSYDSASRRFGTAFTATYADHKRSPDDIIGGNTTLKFRVPSYTVYDLTAYWRINDHAALTVGLYNLTDKKRWDYASVRGLAATGTSEIERQALPGFNTALSLSLRY